MFQRALISVTDKTGLINFLNQIKINEIVSTSGTAKYLNDNGISCVEVSEVTNFSEVLGGRVKTLHPKIHMPLLARLDRAEDVAELNQLNIKNFDLVIVNLYDFETHPQIENIDIGGVAILRAASKNYEWVTVLTDPNDYQTTISFFNNRPNQLAKIRFNKKLAAKSFSNISLYDQNVSKFLLDEQEKEDSFIWKLKSVEDFKYGENPQQKASRYIIEGEDAGDYFEKLHGPDLSFNNFLDIKSGLELAADLDRQFKGEKVSVGIKHSNPCSASAAKEANVSLNQMLNSDGKSIFGGVVVCNYEVTEDIANRLGQIFLEVIIATNYTEKALAILSAKKKLKIIRTTKDQLSKINDMSVNGFVWGSQILIQDKNFQVSRPSDWQFVGGELSFAEIKDILFAETVGKHLKSNAIAIVKNQTTLGLGMGQVNRSDAVKHAVDRMLEFHPNAEGVTLFSDAFFPFKDSIELLPADKIKTVVQPGGSIRDAEVETECLLRGFNHVKTQIRHFRH
jgi:phosphoribosylaminoimidazolecarboxamide formyltransferase/IMP cyclohydrolase